MRNFMMKYSDIQIEHTNRIGLGSKFCMCCGVDNVENATISRISTMSRIPTMSRISTMSIKSTMCRKK